MKYRVFFNKAEVKKIPLIDYDFKAALTDETFLRPFAAIRWLFVRSSLRNTKEEAKAVAEETQ